LKYVVADYKNESEVGEALKEAFDTGLVKREDLFITTKVNFHNKFC
jgi:aldehyde reductase